MMNCYEMWFNIRKQVVLTPLSYYYEAERSEAYVIGM
jgi:hypothetical protein